MKKAFTMIELMVVVAIVAVLSIVLLPKATQAMAKAKVTGVDKNQQFLEGMVRATLDKHYYSAPTAEEVVQRTYTQLSKNEEVANLTNPFDKTRKGIGLIEGSTFTDTNKAAYIFTDTPNTETLPEGTVYVVVKDGEVVSTTPQVSQGSQAPGELTMVTTVEGQQFSIAIGSDGNLYSWGANYDNQLGTGDKIERETPTLVNLPDGVKPLSISAGSSHSIILGTDGNTYTWGSNSYMQLGTKDTQNKATPTLVNLPNGAKPASVMANYLSSLAIDSNGNLYTWGSNIAGKLGVGDINNKNTPTLVNLLGGVKVKTATMSYSNLQIIGTDGNLYISGNNDYGQIGIGGTLNRTTPTLISLASGVKPISIAVGNSQHMAAIGDDGNLYTWGANGMEQLGTGDTTTRTTPTKITLSGGAKPKSITAGEGYTEVITTTGETIILGTK